MRVMRLRRLAVVAFLTLAANVIFLSAQEIRPSIAVAAEATLPGYVDSVTLTAMRRQEALRPAVDILQQAILASDVGFAGIAFEGDGVTLYWKGAIPSEVEQAVSSARKIGTIKIEAARFSESELTARAKKIWEIAQPDRSERAKLVSDIASIIVHGDGSGLTVNIMRPDIATEVATKSGLKDGLTSGRQAASSMPNDIPVTFVENQIVGEALDCANDVCSRLDDESPWNSGAFAANVTLHPPKRTSPYLCSTGFAVYSGSSTKLLTAAHCGSAGDYFTDWTDEGIGYMGLDSWQYDIGTINAAGWYWMWDGPTTSTSHRVVRSWQYSIGNEYICQSGYHQSVCGMVTQAGEVAIGSYKDSDGDYITIHDLRWAIKQDSGNVGVPGDSGGPVYTFNGDGTVNAKGIVSGRSKTSASNPHYNVFYWQDMDLIISLGLYPRTG